ncbi:PREDICTED: hemK methyltransferase family member 2 [Polistes dominula]|uniref:HemK methyltransferase family member 2 n=1 Tax=Polistes dominula TaxID=743375 RepID=A0ABM1J3N8_POLDO|nr:PREDICTED: hemK methyltransferase family member 2 [Polistes dominula]
MGPNNIETTDDDTTDMQMVIYNITYEERNHIYEPREDTFTLINTLEQDLKRIRLMNVGMILEIGSGSGVVIATLAKQLKKDNIPCYYLATDINPEACKFTEKTGRSNVVDINVVQMDLLNNIRYNEMFDIIIFNPPYVVTPTEETTSSELIYRTWAGGQNGREVMEKAFPYIPRLLSNIGVFYLLVIKDNNPNYIIESFRHLGMTGTIVKKRKIMGERLYVIRFTKDSNVQ